MKATDDLQKAVAAVKEINDIIASGDDVPIIAFGKWEIRVQTILDELLTQYHAAGDTAGVERIKVLQAQVDKVMLPILKGAGNSA